MVNVQSHSVLAILIALVVVFGSTVSTARSQREPEAPRLAAVAAGEPADGPANDAAKERAEWLNLLVATVARNKSYPPGAVLRNEEGTATVRFRMERTGKLLDHRLEKSSGFAELDWEALALIKRVKLPPFASTMPESEMEFTLPVRFGISDTDVPAVERDPREYAIAAAVLFFASIVTIVLVFALA